MCKETRGVDYVYALGDAFVNMCKRLMDVFQTSHIVWLDIKATVFNPRYYYMLVFNIYGECGKFNACSVIWDKRMIPTVLS
ncbi:hypothetical protein CEXT_630341 [Caerostris extrusa]|uniref:Uncharacterized protein n=1 Tax=Caerostris extrusa TaxID=172846 RepID=A0AAV4QMH0_CAEEX|nr:hypothetical protein CEXT_630341 [Caerostris extrusa]